MPDYNLCSRPVCDNPITGRRVDAKYCSDDCKHQAYLERAGVITKKPKTTLICECGCGRAIPETARADTKYFSNACRQKVWNDANKEKAKEKHAAKVAARNERKKVAADKKAVDDFINELMN